METLKDVGAVSGTVATISISHINGFISVIVGLATLIFIIPGAIQRWRQLFEDFKTYKYETGNRSFILFVIRGWLFNPKQTAETVSQNKDRNGI